MEQWGKSGCDLVWVSNSLEEVRDQLHLTLLKLLMSLSGSSAFSEGMIVWCLEEVFVLCEALLAIDKRRKEVGSVLAVESARV